MVKRGFCAEARPLAVSIIAKTSARFSTKKILLGVLLPAPCVTEEIWMQAFPETLPDRCGQGDKLFMRFLHASDNCTTSKRYRQNIQTNIDTRQCSSLGRRKWREHLGIGSGTSTIGRHHGDSLPGP